MKTSFDAEHSRSIQPTSNASTEALSTKRGAIRHRGETDSERLRQEIEKTRAVVAADLLALRGKLTKDNVKRDVKNGARRVMRDTAEGMKHRARSAGSSTLGYVRENPIPVALVGLGLGWLMVGATRKHRGGELASYEEGFESYEPMHEQPGQAMAAEPLAEGASETKKGRVHRAGESVQNAAGRAREASGRLIQGTKDAGAHAWQGTRRAGGAAWERTRGAGQRTRQQMQRRYSQASEGAAGFFEKNPIGVGMVAAAAGAGLGLLIPSTHSEQRYLGGARDRLKEEAQNKLRAAREVAETTGRSARETLKHEASRKGLTGGDERSSDKEAGETGQAKSESGYEREHGAS